MRKAFTLVAVAIVGMIAIPSFLNAGETSPTTTCQPNLQQTKSVVKDQREACATACRYNLEQIDTAKKLWAFDNGKPETAKCTFADLVGRTLYIKAMPACPSGGTYTVNAVNTTATCSIGANTDNPAWSHVLIDY